MTHDAPEPDDRRPDDDPRAPTPLRLLSLLAVGVVFVLYRPGAEPSLLQSAILPLLGLLAAWYLTRSLFVISLGAALLAGAHADPSSTSILVGRIYPLISAVATIVLLVILVARFRRAMAARRRMRGAGDDR